MVTYIGTGKLEIEWILDIENHQRVKTCAVRNYALLLHGWMITGSIQHLLDIAYRGGMRYARNSLPSCAMTWVGVPWV